MGNLPSRSSPCNSRAFKFPARFPVHQSSIIDDNRSSSGNAGKSNTGTEVLGDVRCRGAAHGFPGVSSDMDTLFPMKQNGGGGGQVEHSLLSLAYYLRFPIERKNFELGSRFTWREFPS
jgi:hypothetical protein